MNTFFWILASGLLMSAIALVGSATLLLKKNVFERFILPLVALAAGSLIGGALFHMIPASLEANSMTTFQVFGWVAGGFLVFLAMEQFIHHHHCHRPVAPAHMPLTYLILIGDGVHNFLGGLAVGGTFLLDIRLGVTTWLAAAAHEVPQELGDFGALVHGGWTKRRALMANLISALMFPLGGVLTYAVSFHVNTDFLIAFAAGNFLYIGASDLVPEVNKARSAMENVRHFLAFALGLGFLAVIKLVLE
ncbi:MAG: Zinc transporter ZupT [Elusimicrobia bacterium]|nr:Zinc transporter ZupT [Elusimicrobiota bacterium]